MGDLYEFDGDIVDGKEVLGFYYQNKNNNYQGTFVQFNEEQEKEASVWRKKLEELEAEKVAMIKRWLEIEGGEG